VNATAPADPRYFASFDVFERYGIAASLVRTLAADAAPLVLDVGGFSEPLWDGFPSLVGAFLPEARSYVLDPEKRSGLVNYAAGSAIDLPFADRAFDFVLAQDTLEHIRPNQRRGFLREMARVCRRAVLLSFPFFTPLNQACDRLIQSLIRVRRKPELKALTEHLELGLPRLDQVREWIAELGLPAQLWTHGNAFVWLHMMAAKNHFWAQGAPELGRELDYVFNAGFAAQDYQEPCYRCYVLLGAGEPPQTVLAYQDAFRAGQKPAPEAEIIHSLCQLLVGMVGSHEAERRLGHGNNLLEELSRQLVHVQTLLESRLADSENRLTETKGRLADNRLAETESRLADRENRLAQAGAQMGAWEAENGGLRDRVTEVSKQLWAKEADERLRYGKGFHWVESPIVAEYMNRNISGDPAVNWVAYSARKYLAPRRGPRVLSLGCGGGALERDLLVHQPEASILALDFSPGAIELAAAHAGEAGRRIDYRVADLNQESLEERAFDIVYASSALHHIAGLERLLEQIRRALRPGGVLIVNDYVGPNQLQWTPQQVRIINEVLELLPDRYRRRVSDPNLFKREFPGPSPVEEMNRHDPSEAVRSAEMLPLVGRLFRLLEIKPFGGTLLHMLLQDIIGNFRPDDERDNCALRLICYLEWKLIEEGRLPSDFVYFAAEPLPG